METVFIAMSGGIDSTFAARFLKQKGFNVVGITFELIPEFISGVKTSEICSVMDASIRAKKICDELSIPHHVINLKNDFAHYVIENFINEYKAGRTPNPCVLCNRHIKFSSFPQKARQMGGDAFATGHYARVENKGNECILKKGLDATKDQSYFLYAIDKGILRYLHFPLGAVTKAQVRAHFTKPSRFQHSARESQDICFLRGGNYRPFLTHFVHPRKGSVYLTDGRLIGHHNGIHYHTIGQRRGLNIPYGEPLYVVAISADDNALIVGTKDHLGSKKLIAMDFNILHDTSEPATGRVRYNQKVQGCSYSTDNGVLEVTFHETIHSIAPGQSVVLYAGDTVIGGGIIEKSLR